jgi:hypothetical protein
VQLVNGIAGDLPISVILAIKDNAMEIMLVNTPKTNCPSARVNKYAHLKLIILLGRNLL